MLCVDGYVCTKVKVDIQGSVKYLLCDEWTNGVQDNALCVTFDRDLWSTMVSDREDTCDSVVG